MSYPYAFDQHHAAIRAEMRELRLSYRAPYSTVLLSLVAASCAASAILTLVAA